MFRWLRDETGATSIEYGVMCVMLGTGLIAGFALLGEALDALMTDSAEQVDDAL